VFRDNELRYVLASVLLAWTIAILLGAYEIFVDRADTVLETVVAVITGAAAATGMTVLVVATGEVFMVLYRRVNERRLAAAREEGREEERRRLEEEHRRLEEERRQLREWFANLPQEFKDQLPPPF
jgi:type VI protein secretion system component VasK